MDELIDIQHEVNVTGYSTVITLAAAIASFYIASLPNLSEAQTTFVNLIRASYSNSQFEI